MSEGAAPGRRARTGRGLRAAAWLALLLAAAVVLTPAPWRRVLAPEQDTGGSEDG